MSLFNAHLLEKHLEHIQFDPRHMEILAKWAENLEKGVYDVETQSDGEFIQHILIDVLGYVSSSEGQRWTLAKNQPVGHGNVDVALGSFTPDSASIIAPFELKGARTHNLDAVIPGRNKNPVQQAWEYAMDAKGARWVLVSNFRTIRLYAVGYGRKEYENFDLTREASPGEHARLMLLLSAKNLLGGHTLALLEESERTEKGITDELYRDYKGLRSRLIKTMDQDSTLDRAEAIRCAQTILDRVLFIAFAEDRDLLPQNTLNKPFNAAKHAISPVPIWENFKDLFRAIDEGSVRLDIPCFNGGLFASDAALDSLAISDELCLGFARIGTYDFESEHSVNILGHILEQSIADIDEMKNLDVGANRSAGRRKKEGVFYTPPHLTHYIVEQALGGWLEAKRKEIGFGDLPELPADVNMKAKKGKGLDAAIVAHVKAWEAYREALSNVKVLDPACGSGAFLVEVFDYLVREGKTVNNELTRLRGYPSLFRWETHILANNIFGVDLNHEAVEITKLSLWLKTANKDEKLSYLDDNIKVGNSLIDDSTVAGALAFDWAAAFPDIMQLGGFDVVVGNPPYVFAREKIPAAEKAYYSKCYRSARYQVNTYILFIEKALDLVKEGHGRCSLIVPNAWLMVGSGENLRRLLLKGTTIHSITNLLGQSFESASVETVVLGVQKMPSAEGHEIQVYMNGGNDGYHLLHTSPQGAFSTDAGNELRIFASNSDAPILGKLRDSSADLDELFEVRAGLQAYEAGCGQPAQSLEDVTNRIYDFREKIDEVTHKYLDGRDVGRYWHKWDGTWLRYGVNLAAPRDIRLFSSPAVIVREITGKHPRCLNCAHTDGSEVLLFNRSNIAVLGRDPAYDLKYMLGILNSSTMSYYFMRSTPKSVRKLFPKIILADLRHFPIKTASPEVQQPIISAVDAMLMAQTDLMGVVSAFLNLTKLELDIQNPGRDLKAWYTLDAKTFIEALGKTMKPQKLGLAKKSEWLDHFGTQKARADASIAAIDSLDTEINRLVYALYCLTADETAVIENQV